jgi:PAS domain S-box-containing protein
MNQNEIIKILFAEDSKHDAELVQREIKKSFANAIFEITDNRFGFEEALRNFKPDLVVSDYRMPSFSAMEALQIVLKSAPDLPLIVVTGSINEETAVECLKAGAVDYILKESMKRLGQAIKQAMDQKEIKRKRKKAEALLKESEERFRRLTEHAQDMIFRIERYPENHFGYVNHAALQITGYSPEEFYLNPKLTTSIVHPDDRYLQEQLLNDQIDIRTPLTLRWVKKNGAIRWTEIRNIPVYDDKGKLISIEGIARDIHEQKQNEQKLLQSDRIFNFSLDLFCMVDFKGYFRLLNPAWEFTLGWRREELMEKPWVEFVHPDDQKPAIRMQEKIIEGNEVFRFENRYLCKNGTVKWLAWNVHPFPEEQMMIATCRDITQYKEVLTELTLREQEYRGLINGMNESIWIISNEGKLLDVNQAAVDMLEYSREELLSPAFESVIQMNLKKTINNNADQLPENKTQVFETVHTTKSGSDIPVEVSTTPMVFRGDRVLLCVARDITERQEQQKALLQSEEKFRSLFDNHSAAKIMIDPENGLIVEANKAAASLYGWPVQQLTQMNIRDLDPFADKRIEELLTNVNDNTSLNLEIKHQKANNTVFDVEVFSSKVEVNNKTYLHAIIHDITEKKMSERELRLLKRAVEQSPVTMLITNKQGQIEYVNPTFTKVTGYELNEVKGKNPRFLKSSFHDQQFYENMWSALLSGNDWMGELHNKRKDGNFYWEDAVISPIFNSQKKITHFVSVREDITEKKKMIEDLVTAKEKAEESDRLKSAFLANMSHEIRTPMNGILGFAELLKEPHLNDGTKEQYIKIIEESGQRMLETINDLVDISRIESGTVEVEYSSVCIHEKLDALYHFFQPEANKKGLELRYISETENQDTHLNTDQFKLNAILINLIKNAIKYTSKGWVELGFRKGNNSILFYVKDTGDGIEQERHEAIFERFVQADNKLTKSFEGAGLGLSISKAYTNMLGGTIWVESAPGEGSCFWIELPFEPTN